MDIKEIFQAAYKKELAAAAAREKQREKVKRAYIAAHGDLVGLVLYREYLEQEAK